MATDTSRPRTSRPLFALRLPAPPVADRRPRRAWAAEAALAGAVLLAGLYLVPLRAVGSDFSRIPGTLDSRFNNYVLEHGWRWLTGRDPSFWDAPFYYPQPGVTAYSDAHLGTLPLYGLLRAAGLDRETAFQGWFLAFFPLNFLACYWALRRLPVRPLGAAAGAYHFAFGLPVVGQFEHLQLLPRFPAPVALYFAARACDRGGARAWAGLAAAVVAQFYAAIYLGYFLCLLLVAFVPAYLVLRRPAVLRAWIPEGGAWSLAFPACLLLIGLGLRRERPGCFAALAALAVLDAVRRLGLRGWARWAWRGPCGGSRASAGRRAAGVALVVAALLPLLLPYMRVYRQRGGHAADQVGGMLPRPVSWVTAPTASELWGRWNAGVRGLPFAGEHALFLGAVPMAALLAAAPLAAARRRGRAGATIAAGLIALAAVAALTLMTPVGSLYEWLLPIPGPSAIRAVSRVVVVLLLPAGAALAFAASALEGRLRRRAPAAAALLPLVLLPALAVDQLADLGQVGALTKSALQESIRQAAAEVRPRVPDARAVLYVGPDPMAPGAAQADAATGEQLFGMEVAQALGVPTPNGYSALAPLGWPLFRRWSDVARWEEINRGRAGGPAHHRQQGYADHGFEGLAVLGDLAPEADRGE
jgi:hypothetical protein